IREAFNEKFARWVMSRIDAGLRDGRRATGAIQRDWCHHGPLAPGVARRQCQQADLVAMGGKLVTRGSAVGVWFPGARVNLNLGEEPPGKGGSVGSVINHVGFIVNNVQEQTAKWKAAGVPVLAGNNNRLDQAFVVTPDGVRVEILEDKTQTIPIQ